MYSFKILKNLKNIIAVILLFSFGMTIFQFTPLFKKAGLKSELVKKNLTDGEENDTEEKDSDDEKKDNDELFALSPDLFLNTTLDGAYNSNNSIANYLSVQLSNNTPPPEHV